MTLKLRWLLAVTALVGPLATVSVVALNVPKQNLKSPEKPQPARNSNDSRDSKLALTNRSVDMSERELSGLERVMPQLLVPTERPEDGDMMMADMPLSTDDAGAKVQPEEFGPEAERERNEKLQLKIVKRQISDPLDTFTEKTKRFYPVCGLPKHTDRSMYSTSCMNIIFNMNVPKLSNNDFNVRITAATLRLYKQLLNSTLQLSNESLFDKTTFASADFPPSMMEDRQIRVSIYMYTKISNKKRVRRRLLNSYMVPYYSEKWTEWNILKAVKTWHQDPSNNFGLCVEVEDEDGNVQIPTDRFFKPMNCHPAITNASLLGSLVALHNNAYRYPVLHLSTIEVVKSDSFEGPN